MTQEEKDLLLKDLCGRLPYGVKCQCFDEKTIASLTGIKSNTELYFDELDYKEFDGIIEITYCKPYLFPLSSMTGEEKEEYRKVCELDTEILSNHPMDGTPFPALYNSQDWLNTHHYDYRGLIPAGAAIDATGLNVY